MSAPCRCLRHPLLTHLRPVPRVRVLKGANPPTSWSLRSLESLPSRGSSKKRWKPAHVSCFKDEKGESSCSNISSEFIEIKPAGELDKAEVEESSIKSKHWFSSIQKQWKPAHVSCFKDENGESSCSNISSEFIEIKPAGELDKAEVDESSIGNKHWFSSIQQIVNRIGILHDEPWTVPWTAETIIQVMLLWIASFWFVGSWIIPFLAHAAGFSKESLTHRGQALYSLLTDIAEGLAGIAILHRCLARFRPLPSGWFRFSLRGSWHLDVGLACLLFPLVNSLSQININLVPVLPAPPVGVSSVEQSIVARDPVAMALYAVVVSVCAPVWEEIVFRGFLLPSLTRYMPLWSSIVVSALAFALAHFNAQRLLPLVFLGMVMGAVFARSRNLLASMLLHSLWNGFVFLDLMK